MVMMAQDLALLADVDFVSKDEFEAVGLGQVVARGFQEAHVAALEEFGEGECAGRLVQYLTAAVTVEALADPDFCCLFKRGSHEYGEQN
jgi:hypothetical protein